MASRMMKQLNKASQYMNEKVLKAERTAKDEEFVALEAKTDATAEVVKSMVDKVHSVLQPNPTARVKILARNKVSGKQGQQRHYPHSEGVLGDVMLKGATDLGDDSHFGLALQSAGNVLKEVAECRENLDITVNQNFIDPLNQLLSKEIKEISQHRKKMESRRLDYDGKKRKLAKGAVLPEGELDLAEEKFAESQELTFNSMVGLMDNEMEQICQLQALVEAMVEFHRGALDAVERLQGDLSVRYEEAGANAGTRAQRREPVKKKRAAPPAPGASAPPEPEIEEPSYGMCRAVYEFVAENAGEISFNVGDEIILHQRIDDNWLEGEVHGERGIFPDNFVEIITPC